MNTDPSVGNTALPFPYLDATGIRQGTMETPARPGGSGSSSIQPSSAGQLRRQASQPFLNSSQNGLGQQAMAYSSSAHQQSSVSQTLGVGTSGSPSHTSSLPTSSYQQLQQIVGSAKLFQSPPAQLSADHPARRGHIAPTVPVNAQLLADAHRAVLAKQLRANLVLLLAWYLVTDSRAYAWLVREAIQAYPDSRLVILWLLHRILPLLCLYNASEAFLRIRFAKFGTFGVLSSVKSAVPRTQPASSVLGQSAHLQSMIHKSSPKTRASPALVASPSVQRSTQYINGSPQSVPRPPAASSPFPATSTPTRPLTVGQDSPTIALRQMLLAGKSSPNTTTAANLSTGDTGAAPGKTVTPARNSASPRVQAYWARHEPVASPLYASSADVDRLIARDLY